MMESHPALISSCEEHTALLVKRYGAQLVGLCSRLLRDHDLAQDAVQKPLLKAYLKRGSFSRLGVLCAELIEDGSYEMLCVLIKTEALY